MSERKPSGTSFESWIEAQISRAQARGDFADLPGAGRPLPRRDGPETSYDWAVRWARRENGDVAGLLPPGLALRKEREELVARAARRPTEAEARALVEDFNDRVRAFWRRPHEGPPVAVGLADGEEVVAAWRAAHSRPADVPVAAPPPPGAPRPRRRPWWVRRPN